MIPRTIEAGMLEVNSFDEKTYTRLRMLARLKRAEELQRSLARAGSWQQADVLYFTRKRVLRRRKFIATRRYQYV